VKLYWRIGDLLHFLGEVGLRGILGPIKLGTADNNANPIDIA